MTESVLGGLQRERERWILWVPVAVGAGVALYFSLPVEPPFWLGGLLLGAAVVLGVSLRHHPALLRIMWVLGAVALGLTSIQVRSIVMSAPVLDRSSGIIAFEGRIVDIEPQETGTRIILNHLRLPRLRWDGPTPKQVRVHFRQDVIGVHPGQWVALRQNHAEVVFDD